MLRLDNFIELEVDGIDMVDFPEFSDAYFCSAFNELEQREATPEELDQLTDNYPEELYQLVIESVY